MKKDDSLCSGARPVAGDAVRRGPKEIKSQTRTIHTVYSISYNPHFQKQKKKDQ